jgi:hypothetical protein
MASTRNKNTQGNYNLEQVQKTVMRDWFVYPNAASGAAYNTKLPGFGFNHGKIGSSVLSNNSADIESYLFGINSTNLVTPQGPITPQLNSLDSISLFPKPDLIMPIPQVIPKYQRPFSHF